MTRLHRQATRLQMALGPGSPVVRSIVHRRCAPYGVTVSFGDHLDLTRDARVIRLSPRHWIYARSLAMSFDTYFGQVEPTAEDGRLVVDYSSPRLQTYRSGRSFEIASFPEEEEAIADYFRWYTPTEGDVIFDIGAYCGVSTYAFSKVAGHVYSFEPDATSHALLLRNIERHQLANVTPLRLAFAASTGASAFHQEGTLGSVLSRHSPRATTGTIQQVETITLEDACQRFGVPAFIKMDIEGSEVEVLESSRAFLREHRIAFALDTHHWLRGTRTTDAVERILRDCGYDVTSSDASGFWTTWGYFATP